MQQRQARLADRLQFEARKRGRAVEGTGLENRRRGNPFVSSNLTASAKFPLEPVAAPLSARRIKCLRKQKHLGPRRKRQSCAAWHQVRVLPFD